MVLPLPFKGDGGVGLTLMSCGSRLTGICSPLTIILPLSLANYLITFCSLLVKLANDDREGFGNAFCSQSRLLNLRFFPSGRTTFTALSDHVTTEPFGISSPLARRCSCAKVTVVPFTALKRGFQTAWKFGKTRFAVLFDYGFEIGVFYL